MSRPRGLAKAFRWSSISVVGGEVVRLLVMVVLARQLGPEAFGVVAQAIVFIAISTLVLDLGFSTALIQREVVTPQLAGAVASINLGTGVALAGLTLVVAPYWSSFMHTPELTAVLSVLSVTLVLRGAGATPRAMLIRNLDFAATGRATLVAAMLGGAAGVAAALLGANYWALVVQVLTTDVLLTTLLLLGHRDSPPNLHLRQAVGLMGFGLRSFAAGLLVNGLARNLDNLLIGRFFGSTPLAYYALAYRMVLLPVQLIGRSVAAVLLPSISRYRDDPARVREDLTRVTRTLAAIVLPLMALAAVSAPESIPLVFGTPWLPAVPVMQILAVTGAVQAVYAGFYSLMLAFGQDRLGLRFAMFASFISVVGIVAGLSWGLIGVALGYTVANLFLVPCMWFVHRRLLGTPLWVQVRLLAPAVHLVGWTVLVYSITLVVVVRSVGSGLAMLFGAVGAIAMSVLVLRFVHPRTWAAVLNDLGMLLGHRLSGRARRQPPGSRRVRRGAMR